MCAESRGEAAAIQRTIVGGAYDGSTEGGTLGAAKYINNLVCVGFLL